MGNMGYCRFNNTLSDLEDCRDALREGNISSLAEKRKAKRLLKVCREIADNFDEDYIDSIHTDDEDEDEEED